jgi:hypothetical protein
VSLDGCANFPIAEKTHLPSPIQITQPFELYVTLSPILPKSAVIGAANAVVKWVRKEENKLFLRDAPVF